MASESVLGDMSPSEKMNQKEIVAGQVKGKVKWFNVDLGYGFIHREDTKDDIFVHHTAIAKYNPRHQLSSLADGEEVEFDVVRGKKGFEASNVSGPSGEIVKGSRFASNLYAGRFRFRRGSNYGGGSAGRRFYSRRYNRDADDYQKSHADESDKGIEDKPKETDGEIKKQEVPTKKYSKTRRGVGDGGVINDGYSRLKRSCSLPSNLGDFAADYYRRGRRGRHGGRFVRFTYGMKRRGLRTTSEKEADGNNKVQGQKIDNSEAADSSKSEKGQRRQPKGQGQEIANQEKSASRRKLGEEKSEKSETTTTEKSDKSQQPRGKKYNRKGKAKKSQDEVDSGKTKVANEVAEDHKQHQESKDASGDGKKD